MRQQKLFQLMMIFALLNVNKFRSLCTYSQIKTTDCRFFINFEYRLSPKYLDLDLESSNARALISAIYRSGIKSLNKFDMLWVSHLNESSFSWLDGGRRNQYIVVWVLTGLPVFFWVCSLMNEGDPKNREHWVQITTTIPEISSTDHSRNQTTDKIIISIGSAYK